jgi:hypothetical protein
MALFSDTMYKVISFFVDIDIGHIDVYTVYENLTVLKEPFREI